MFGNFLGKSIYITEMLSFHYRSCFLLLYNETKYTKFNSANAEFDKTRPDGFLKPVVLSLLTCCTGV